MNTNFSKSCAKRLIGPALVIVLWLCSFVAHAQNTATGFNALNNNTTGHSDTADGSYALSFNTKGNWNTANGSEAMYHNTTGSWNSANGAYSLFLNTTGNFNAANGNGALYSNTTGSYNAANGGDALFANTTGNLNAANGYQALYFNTTGNNNTANGSFALFSNTIGSNNTANGYEALFDNTTGNQNVANGLYALYSNTTGSNNIADGSYALYNTTTGNDNTAVGLFTLYLNQTGSNNIAIGYGAGQNIASGSNNISIGNGGVASDHGVIRIGTPRTQQATFIAGINGVTASQGVPVYINANGQLGTLTSSARFKYDIHSLGAVSDKLMRLRPVSFRYKAAAEDGSHPIQYGLIAEEVAQVYPDMVQYDNEGKPFTVYYQQLTPMMLNELQKAHQDINSLKAELQNQSTEMGSLRRTEQLQLLVLSALVMTTSLVGAFVRAARKRHSR
ncbi:MAG TPA: tail fiber domain-containing protein [Chthonomonadaceae bacterium]|nr:tail fiber domain-containing protein [Chthonomonadaceae bacterium]